MKNSVRLVDQAMATKLEQATQSQLRAVAKGFACMCLRKTFVRSDDCQRGGGTRKRGLSMRRGDKLEVFVSFLDEVQWKPGEQAESDAEMKKP